MIGLITFNKIADRINLTFDKTYAYSGRQPNSIQATHSRRSLVIIKLRKQLNHTKNIPIIEDIEKYRSVLGQLLKSVDSQIGQYLQINSTNKFLTDILNKEKLALIDVLYEIISSISRIPPLYYTTVEMIQFLINKSFHMDPRISKLSKSLLFSFIQSRPSLRVIIIEELCKFITQITDQHIDCSIQFIRSTISLLIECLIKWNNPLVIHSSEIDFDYLDQSINHRDKFSLSVLEGFSLIALCNSSIHVRNDVFKLLNEINLLYHFLPDHLIAENDRNKLTIINIIEKYEFHLMKNNLKNLNSFYSHHGSSNAFSQFNSSNNTSSSTSSNLQFQYSSNFHQMKNNYFNYTQFPPNSNSNQRNFTNYSSFEQIIAACSEGEQEEWSNCLANLINKLRIEDSNSIFICFSLICIKLENLTSSVLLNSSSSSNFNKRSDKSNLIQKRDFSAVNLKSLSDHFITWKNFILSAFSISDPDLHHPFISTFNQSPAGIFPLFFFFFFYLFLFFYFSLSLPLGPPLTIFLPSILSLPHFSSAPFSPFSLSSLYYFSPSSFLQHLFFLLSFLFLSAPSLPLYYSSPSFSLSAPFDECLLLLSASIDPSLLRYLINFPFSSLPLSFSFPWSLSSHYPHLFPI